MSDDKPFDFNLDAVKAEAKKLPPFRVHYKGRRWEMTHRQHLDQIPLLEAAARSEAEGMLAGLQAALGKQWEDFRKLGLNGDQIEALVDAYNEYCGAEPGESSGSTGS